MNTTKKSMSKKGNLNPMFGRRHSVNSKQKMSLAHIQIEQQTTNDSKITYLRDILQDSKSQLIDLQVDGDELLIRLKTHLYDRLDKIIEATIEDFCKKTSRLV